MPLKPGKNNEKTHRTLHRLSARMEFTDAEKAAVMAAPTSLFKNFTSTIISTSPAPLADDAPTGVIRLPRSTLLVGDHLYNGIWHPDDELAKSWQTMEHQPFIIDHKDGVEDEIGYMEDARYDPQSKKLSAVPVLNLNTAKGTAALNYIKNRLMANKTPETSVGFWATERVEPVEMLNNAEHTTAREWEFDHNALVTRGAGTPEMGVGIGLSQGTSKETITKEPVMNLKIKVDTSEVDAGENSAVTTNGVIRQTSQTVIIINAEWDTSYINDLPDGSFAYIEPGGSKDGEGKTTPRSLRHFPYKDKDGKIDLPHLRNALARASQSPFGDKALPKLKAAAKEAGVGEEAKKSD